ncbi:MAG: hypothetical protein KDD70_17400, partial [Bdellovibrionales bacterium]|nr:hypothetical protein [Bdellovibrionales bacterium]
MKRKRASTSLNLQSEEGFVLIWTLYMIIPLVTLSFLFLMYSQSYNRKLDAQYYAMNITMSGTRSAEFDTDETVNNMAAFAHASGLTGAAPTRLWQSTANGDVAFVHDTESSRLHSVTTFLVFSQGVLGNMIDNATGVDVVGVSQAKPNPVLINLV